MRPYGASCGPRTFEELAMNWIDLLRAVFGLAITLGLIGLAAYALRRYAPELMARLQTHGERRERRLKVIETLILDPSRRLVLVRVDQEERLILLGEGRELIEPRGPVAPVHTDRDNVQRESGHDLF